MRCASCGFSPCACGDEAYTDDAFLDRMEDLILNHQFKLIKEQFGEKLAGSANYGYSVDDSNGSVSTKIYYPSGAKILTTRIETKFTDDWS